VSAVVAELIESLRRRLTDLPIVLPELELLVLFGSAASGRTTPASDLDLAVACEGAADLDALHLGLAPRLGTDRLDLVDLRRADPLLAFGVARRGHPLFERRPGLFRDFQSLASRRYCDTDKLRRAQRRAIQVFLEREGLR
jgi:predicted nucleotidyltransferase